MVSSFRDVSPEQLFISQAVLWWVDFVVFDKISLYQVSFCLNIRTSLVFIFSAETGLIFAEIFAVAQFFFTFA